LIKELTSLEKVAETNQALQTFSNEFGDNDAIKQIFFDILVETMYETRDDLPVPGETEQKQRQNIDESRKREMPTYEIE
jgi:hypothetical protein